MPRKSEVIIVTDTESPTGYALVAGNYRDSFGSAESIEVFKPVRSFRFMSMYGDFVARQERRAGRPYWYGYKRFGAVVRKVYLGRHHRLTLHSLEEAAAQLHSCKDVTQSAASI